MEWIWKRRHAPKVMERKGHVIADGPGVGEAKAGGDERGVRGRDKTGRTGAKTEVTDKQRSACGAIRDGQARSK